MVRNPRSTFLLVDDAPARWISLLLAGRITV